MLYWARVWLSALLGCATAAGIAYIANHVRFHAYNRDAGNLPIRRPRRTNVSRTRSQRRRRPERRAHAVHGSPSDPASRSKCSSLDARPAIPTFTWIGCVVAIGRPESLNGVAPLPGQQDSSPRAYPRGDDEARGRARWPRLYEPARYGNGIRRAAGASFPGANSPGPHGIEVSSVRRLLYVNLWPVRRFMRLSRGLTLFRPERR